MPAELDVRFFFIIPFLLDNVFLTQSYTLFSGKGAFTAAGKNPTVHYNSIFQLLFKSILRYRFRKIRKYPGIFKALFSDF